MMFFWSELPRWFWGLLIVAILAVVGIIYSMVRGQVSVSAGAVQYMDDYNRDGKSSNPRENRRQAPAGGFAPRPGEQPYNTIIDRNKPKNDSFVPSQQPTIPQQQPDQPAPTGNGRGRGGRN